MPRLPRMWAHIKPDRRILETSEDASVWVASTDVTNVDTNTNHREGSLSMSFDKSGTTEAFGQISKTLDTDRQINIIDYLRGQLRFWINLSSLTNIASVQLIIGEDASNNYVYQVADTDLSTGWNEVTFDVDSPDSTNGTGAAWSSIGYIAVKVNFDATGNTLTEILVDAISVSTEIQVNIENVNLSGTDLATATNQTAIQNAAGDGNSVSGDVAHDAVDSGEPVKIGFQAADPTSLPSSVGVSDRVNGVGSQNGEMCVYQTRLMSGEDQGNDVQAVITKPTASSSYAVSTDISSALEASSLSKNSAGNVYKFSGRLDSSLATGTYYIQLGNAASIPADGAVTLLIEPIKIMHATGTDSFFEAEIDPKGVYASLGIWWCVSTTEFTKTIGGNVVSATVQYK